MDYFNYEQGELWAEQCRVSDLAKSYGTPCYIYSRATLERHWHAFDQAFAHHPHLICYAVKANSNLAVLNVLARLGSGFDIVSAGELQRVLKAGGQASKVVFSGVGKQAWEIQQALDAEIYCFNVESLAEIELINQVAINSNKIAPISIRVNPDVDAKTHPYIATGLDENKFGLDISQALMAYQMAEKRPNLSIQGIDCHIGSQLTELAPFLDALDRVLALVLPLKQQGINIQHLDLGGGLGIRYQQEQPPLPADYAKAIADKLAGKSFKILLEPGRAIAGNAGILVTQVQALKTTPSKNFAIVDAAMNDLIRPALYSAWQEIVAVKPRADMATQCYDIVGPICETGDFLGKQRELALKSGDLLAVRSSGAYGFVMSSQYNSRPRSPEIMVDQDKAYVVRARETFEQLIQGEAMLPA